MFITPKELISSSNALPEYCIVGTGPAGLTLALKLAEKGSKVLLLESGELQPNQRTQDLYRGQVIGDLYHQLHNSRSRYFGGTSNIWAGWCRKLDEHDFLRKKEFPDTGWPIKKSDLEKYSKQAEEILEISPPSDDSLLDKDIGLKLINFTYSPPVNFGTKYLEEIKKSENIICCLNTNVTHLVSNGRRINNVYLKQFGQKEISIIPNKIILATGGIENSRILLWSNQKSNYPVVLPSSPLGCYWMDHPHFSIGKAIIFFNAKKDYFFSLDYATQLKLGILNCGLRFHTHFPKSDSENLILDLISNTNIFGSWIAKKARKKLYSGCLLRAAWEQEPLESNCIKLSDTEVDELEIPKVKLYYKKSDRDIKTVRESAIQLGKYLVNNNLGRLKLDDWVLNYGEFPTKDEVAGHHHMGGTRMTDNSAKGIVDKNCKVFGQDNLYIAGSSVFPSAGHANPTLTIVQLALRLAEHLISIRKNF